MCLGPELVPLIASAALATGGSLYNAHQTNKQENKASIAASKATMDNLARQKAQGQKSRDLFAQAQPAQSRPQQDVNLAEAAAKRESGIKANLGPAKGDYAPTPGSAPKVVQGAQDQAGAKGRAKVDAEAAALAKLGGWGDTQQQNRIGLNRAGGQIAESNSFVQGTANLLPGEQNQAVGKVYSKPLSPVGDIAQAAGAAGVNYFYPQSPMPTFADVLGMQKTRKAPKNGLGEFRG